MKLPEEVRKELFGVPGQAINQSSKITERDIAIVRDCAKVCTDLAAELLPYAERNYNAEDTIASECADAILARYGLTSRSGE